MYVKIYRYDVDRAQRERFEQEYGHAGGWVSMFVPADPLTRRPSAHPGQRLFGGPS